VIKKHGTIRIQGDTRDLTELNDALAQLKDDEYLFVFANKDKNRAMNKLVYFHSVVLRTIAEKLAEKNPDSDPAPPMALYRYFEELFAPIHTCKVNEKEYDYFDLKSENASEIGMVIEKTIQYVKKKWGIHVPTEEELNTAPYYKMYAEAYMNQWKGYWSEFLSRRKNQNKDE
jgi:hypothetical protein